MPQFSIIIDTLDYVTISRAICKFNNNVLIHAHIIIIIPSVNAFFQWSQRAVKQDL